ncbi:SdpI family protein [Candidatus Woesearchaeota archaeon]|nr:SdpI family protein [Candidatus Woesearchaeota archaeon]
MKKTTIFALFIVIISFVISIYFYPSFPDQVASHWNSQGEVDGYMGKFWGLFLMPIISLAILLLFLAIPKIDPLKNNIKKFEKYFDGFIVLILLFLFYIYVLTVLWNMNIVFNMTQMILPALGILFFYCGILIENAKRNWFIGIRTPWTLSNEKVWNATHKLGGKLFKIAGILAFIGLFFQKFALLLFIVPVLAFSLYLVVYSYLKYQKYKA